MGAETDLAQVENEADFDETDMGEIETLEDEVVGNFLDDEDEDTPTELFEHEVAKIEPIPQEVDGHTIDEEEDEHKFAEITIISNNETHEIQGNEIEAMEAEANEAEERLVADIQPVAEDVVGNVLIEEEANNDQLDEDEVAKIEIVTDTTKSEYDGTVDFDEREYADITIVSDDHTEHVDNAENAEIAEHAEHAEYAEHAEHAEHAGDVEEVSATAADKAQGDSLSD